MKLSVKNANSETGFAEHDMTMAKHRLIFILRAVMVENESETVMDYVV